MRTKYDKRRLARRIAANIAKLPELERPALVFTSASGKASTRSVGRGSPKHSREFQAHSAVDHSSGSRNRGSRHSSSRKGSGF